MNRITIFTPTYNREYILHELYDSLIMQTNHDFLWLIVDDGSFDQTSEQIEKWIKENKINIKYVYQENSGKHVAHNLACSMCDTDLFMCVDSDDILTKDAIETIINYWDKEENSNIVGYCAAKGGISGEKKGRRWPQNICFSSFFDLYEKYKFRGETALVFKNDSIKEFSFPVFFNEKFVPENVLYYQISYNRSMRIIPDVFYLYEYRKDGYTKSGFKLLMQNPKGFAFYLYQNAELTFNIIKKMRFLAKYYGWIKAFKIEDNNCFKYKNNWILRKVAKCYSIHYFKKFCKMKGDYN